MVYKQVFWTRDSMNTDAIGSLTDKFIQLMQEVEELKKKSNTATIPSS
jgi:hypothetical protein